MYGSPLETASCLYAAIASICPVSNIDLRTSSG